METRPAQVNFDGADITAAKPVDIEMEEGQGYTEETRFISSSTPLYSKHRCVVIGASVSEHHACVSKPGSVAQAQCLGTKLTGKKRLEDSK